MLILSGGRRLGRIWTSWVLGDYTMGVAYSQSGTLDGRYVRRPTFREVDLSGEELWIIRKIDDIQPVR